MTCARAALDRRARSLALLAVATAVLLSRVLVWPVRVLMPGLRAIVALAAACIRLRVGARGLGRSLTLLFLLYLTFALGLLLSLRLLLALSLLLRLLFALLLAAGVHVSLGLLLALGLLLSLRLLFSLELLLLLPCLLLTVLLLAAGT